MESIEIMFDRTSRYRVTLEVDDIKALHAKIKNEENLTGADLPRKLFIELLENGDLAGEHEEGVTAYLLAREGDWEIDESQDICDIEIYEC